MTYVGINSQSAPRRSTSGFTLLELLVTLFTISILLGIAGPSFVDTVRNNRAAANANELVTALSIARSEAVRRGTRITLCGSSDGAGCDGDWEAGWILFVDGALNDTAAPMVDTLLREWGAPSGTALISTRSVGGTAVTMDWVRFLPRGEARTSVPMPVVFNLEIEDCSGLHGRNLELNAVGRTSVERVACSS